jgi:uncharacterized protein DUF3857/transglutaminase superfamily protein
MKPRSYCNLLRRPRATEVLAALCIFCAAISMMAFAPPSEASDAPQWMHALVNAPLPPHDEKTDAVLLYSENILNVQSNGKIKNTERRAYKILRPDGRHYGRVHAYFDSDTRITSIHGWCIPAQGKDYEVKEKDATEMALDDVENGILMTDVRVKVLQIPAADIGNIVGYEIEQEDRPYVLQDAWDFQHSIPVREAHYTLQLPPGWEYKAVWINHAEIKSVASGSNTWQWTISDVPAIRHEDEMPPWEGVVGQMVVTLLPFGGAGQNKGFETWNDMAKWQAALYQGRREASPEIKQKVAGLTASATTPLAKMKVLANFLQQDIRYVGIELGIGGLQPHPASEVFSHRYGDCKDKATLLSSMLHEIGVDSYYIIINTVRGGVSPETSPALNWFNHAILAVRMPADATDSSLAATLQHPKLGRLLIFDPTDEYTPFGQLRGALQANYGLLVTQDGGELVKLPQMASTTTGVQRTAKLALNSNGALSGEVVETRNGDTGSVRRYMLKSVTKQVDQIKPIEKLAAESLPTFQITKATVTNLNQTDKPFGYQYSFVAEDYAKKAGDLILVRPRVIDRKSSGLMETKEPRKFAVEFNGPRKDSDTFEIALPAGYEIDDVPPAVDVDFGFASYHSKTEGVGNLLRYTRTFEVKELSVPASKADDLKKLYRIIASDERNTAVLKPVAH